MRFLKKVHHNIKTKRTNHATKIDVFFSSYTYYFQESFPQNFDSMQSRPSRVCVETIVKKKQLEVILRELSARDEDLLANRYHPSTPSHISPSPIPLK